MDENSLESVQKVLGSPVLGELTDQALKIRRNLLAIGSVSIFVTLTEISLDPSSVVLGFRFVGLSQRTINLGLLVVTAYFLVHFLWYAFDGLLEWRLRVTGTRLGFITGASFGSEHADYPPDPRQSTLYSWWLKHGRDVGALQLKAVEIAEKLTDLQTTVVAEGAAMPQVIGTLSEIRTSVIQLQQLVEKSDKIALSPRIEASLQRFDGWFEFFLRSQNLRFLLIEILLPILVGMTAICLLSQNT